MLVTGGAGFIESNLVQAFVSSEYEVGVLDDFPTKEEADPTANLDLLKVYEKD